MGNNFLKENKEYSKMNKLIILSAILALSNLFGHVESHGKMTVPLSRAAAWKKGWTPWVPLDSEWCADELPKNPRNVSCGVCGPYYNNDKSAGNRIWIIGQKKFERVESFERESKFYTGKLAATYKKNSIVEVEVDIL